MPRPRRQRRLAVPRSLTIRGQRWRVRVAKRVPGDGRTEGENRGLSNHVTRTIWLARGLSEDDRGRTALHEILHASYGDPYEEDAEMVERVISRLEAPLHALLVSGQLVAVPVEEVR